jgi:Ca2+-binding RTX toxin-like protein
LGRGPLDENGQPTDATIDGIHWEAGSEGQIMFGTSWDDILEGNSGIDTINGLQGDDQLIGGAGFDYIFGQEGNDVLWSGKVFMGPYDELHPSYPS